MKLFNQNQLVKCSALSLLLQPHNIWLSIMVDFSGWWRSWFLMNIHFGLNEALYINIVKKTYIWLVGSTKAYLSISYFGSCVESIFNSMNIFNRGWRVKYIGLSLIIQHQNIWLFQPWLIFLVDEDLDFFSI